MQKRKKGLLILITIIIILFFINPKAISYLKAKTGSREGDVSIIKEIETTHSSQIIYEKLDNGLIQYLEGILIYYNMDGEQIWNINLGITRPIIKTNSNSVYVIDKNTNQILRINKKGEQIYKNTLDKPYKNFNICDDNYVVLYHHTDSPVQYITIMNEEGNKVGEITLGEGEVTNIAISRAQDRIAVSTIGINGDTLENNLLVYDLKGNLIGVEGLKNNVILNIFYNEKGDLIAVDEKNIFSIDKNNKVKWETNFNEPIALIDTTGRNYLTMYSEGSSKNSIIYSRTGNKIKTLAYDGKLTGEMAPKEEILGLDNYKNEVIAYSLRTIFKYGKNGNMKFEYPYSRDILKSFALSENHMVVITKEKITFVSSKKI